MKACPVVLGCSAFGAALYEISPPEVHMYVCMYEHVHVCRRLYPCIQIHTCALTYLLPSLFRTPRSSMARPTSSRRSHQVTRVRVM